MTHLGRQPGRACVAPRVAALVALGASWMLVACASPERAVPPQVRVPDAAPAHGASIELRLVNLDPSLGDGPVQIALWNSEASFMKDGGWLRGTSIAIADRDTPVILDGLAAGTYAVSAFHDTRAGGTFRRGAFGIPLDPWAVSNGGSPLLPPSWKRAAFEVREGRTVVELDFHRRKDARP